MTPGRLIVTNTAPTSVVDVVTQATAINGKTVAATNLLTVPANRKLVVLGAVVRLTAVAGFVTVGTADFYVTAPQDVLASSALTGLDTTTEGFLFLRPAGVLNVLQAGDVLKFNVTVGYNAGTATLAVEPFGYYL